MSLSKVLVVGVLCVLGPGVASGLAASSSSGMAVPGEALRESALKSDVTQRLMQRGAPGRREARVRSRSALRGASRAEMLQAGRRHFPDVFSARLFDGRNPDPQMSVIGFRGDEGALVKDADGRKLLLKSTFPLQARAANGELAPVDLSLRESSQTFTTSNSNADVQIFKDPARGIRFVDDGFSISALGGVAPASTDGVQADGRVFFDDVDGSGSDVSSVAVPRPTGVQVGWLLGTADAPETYTLKVDLPDGARLRRTQTDDPIPGDPPRTFEIVGQDGKSLAYITPPMTVDSDGVNVESSMQISGRDRLVVSVQHRGEDLRYPLFVDPEVIVSGRFGSWAGWSTYQTPATPSRVASDYNINYYGWALANPAYYPHGPYMSMPTNTLFDMGTHRALQYRAPPGTYVGAATFGYMSHAAIYPTGTYNAWWQGILNSTRSAWQHQWFGFHSAFGITHSFSAPLSDQNYAILGIEATARSYNQYLWSGSNKAALALDWANVYIADPNAPQLTSPRPADQPWSSTASRTLSVSGSDVGTGLLSFRLTGPGIDKTTYSTWAPCHGAGDWQRLCPIGETVTKDITYTPAEGTHTYTLRAIDAAGGTSNTHTWTEKIDRTSPTLALTGALAAANGGQLAGGQEYPLQIASTDAGTGVGSIKVLLDGDEDDSASQACGPNGGCPLSRTYTLSADGLSPGKHTVTVQAKDVFGHEPTEKTITFTAPGTPPSDTDPNVGDETTGTPASPIPMTPTGLASASAYTTELWLAGDTNTADGVNVVTSIAADKTALTGTVIAPASEDDPVQRATVTLSCTSCTPTSVVTTTDANGAYAFANMPAGTYKLTVEASNYGLYTVTNNMYESNESYYKQTELTADPQTIDELPPNQSVSVAHARARASSGDSYPSVARVPPYVRVALPQLDNECQPLSDPEEAPIRRYSWEFYIQSVITEEVRVLGYNQTAFKAFAAMVQNFAWYHANLPANYDVDRSTGDQCFRPHANVPSRWHEWLHESTFQNRVATNNGRNLEETFFSSGRAERPCADGAVHPDTGEPLFIPNGGRASQYIIKNQGDGTCTGFPTWPSIVEYWDKGEVLPTSAPPPPTVSHGPIPGSAVGVVLNFKSGSERGLAWFYSIQRKVGTGSSTQWKQIGRRISFSPRTRTVPTSYTYETNTTQEYRVRAFSPVGSSRYVEFNDKFVITPG